jgi:superfamily II DNA or RNA helicase/KaiC/GvpD/RAD55 family RecA-like ATPase
MLSTVKPRAMIPDDFRAAQEPLLDDLNFRYPMRGYQREILDLVNDKLARGEREIHIVAPPGAGKTIIGLQMISTLKCPALIVCPNTTIQSQWGGKLDLFLPIDSDEQNLSESKLRLEQLLGTQDDKPLKPITVLTYQVLSTPGREQEYLEKLAHNSWVKELIKGRSGGTGEAELRILEIFQNNPKAYQKEISRHVSRLRKRLAEELDLSEVLHPNAIELLQTLRRQKFKLVLFDECHHLTDYWAAIMQHLVKHLDNPVVIGLTGTPPEKKSASQELRYLNLVGDIDYQVPTPALVREKGLAPFQDLVYFVEPTKKEFEFLSEQHLEFHQLIKELCGNEYMGGTTGASTTIEAATTTFSFKQNAPTNASSLHTGQLNISGSSKDTATTSTSKIKYAPLTQYILDYSQKIESEQGFSKFFAKNTEIASALIRAISTLGLPRPRSVEFSEQLTQPTLEDWMIIIEDFASQKLKLSSSEKSHKLYERIRSATRKLGYAITEQGLRKQASPVDRVLAFSEAKPKAVAEILTIEYRVLQDRLRAVVVTDFESMSATAVKGVLNQESGGAIAAMRILLSSDISTYLNPCMVTGSHLLVDNRIRDQFLEAAKEFIKEAGYNFELTLSSKAGDLFSALSSTSSAWESRLYVALSTSLFERGITKCLIGTRGLFGEGWDSQALNTLIDLTTTTSPVSVKQLRGRSIRIQNDALGLRKVANNWDVVCIAPSLEKGLNDYQRFVRKHDGYFGICDDGQIECGVGHVHPAFSELTPAQVFASIETFNQEMAGRALVRDQIYDLWKIGEPYKNRLFDCLEVAKLRKLALTPPHIRYNSKYKEHAKQIRAALNGVWGEYFAVGTLISAAVAFFITGLGPLAWTAALPAIAATFLASLKRKALFLRLQKDMCQPNSQESSLLDIAHAVLAALQQMKLVPHTIGKESIHATVRSDGSYRIFIDTVDADTSKYFNQSLKEVLSPLSNQPYLIAKYEFALADVVSPEESNRFFRKYINGRAEPRIGSYHAVPNLLARSEKGRQAFQEAWNKYVSPGFVIATETKPELLNKYFGIGPSLAQRLLWE